MDALFLLGSLPSKDNLCQGGTTSILNKYPERIMIILIKDCPARRMTVIKLCTGFNNIWLKGRNLDLPWTNLQIIIENVSVSIF